MHGALSWTKDCVERVGRTFGTAQYPSMETDKGRLDPARAGILKLFNSGARVFP